MQVKIENNHLKQASNLLFNLSLKGTQSRHRTKFIKKLGERLEEVENQRVELAKEHSNKDENGEAIVNDGKFDINDDELNSFSNDLKELYDESFILEGEDNDKMLETIKQVLEECDKEFSGTEASIYDYLCDQFGV